MAMGGETVSAKKDKIKKALSAIGCESLSVEWYPLGMAIEMQGRTGGWIVDEFCPIGHNVDEALDYIARFPESLKNRTDVI